LHASRRAPPGECADIRAATAEAALQCVSRLDGSHFQLFTSFVVHSDIICHHTAQHLYQERAEGAAAALLESATRADAAMRNLSDGLGSVVSDQRQVVRAQSIVIDSVRSTSEVIQAHHGKLSRSIGKLASTSDAAFVRMQDKLGRIDGTLDTILYLERLVVAAAGSAWGAVWYACLVVGAWLATSDVSTSGARPAVAVLTAAAVALEAAVGSAVGGGSGQEPAGPGRPDAMLLGFRAGSIVTAVRYAHAACVVAAVVWRAMTFQDVGRAALSKLSELESLLRSGMRPIDQQCGTDGGEGAGEAADSGSKPPSDEAAAGEPAGVGDGADASGADGAAQSDAGDPEPPVPCRSSSAKRTRRRKR